MKTKTYYKVTCNDGSYWIHKSKKTAIRVINEVLAKGNGVIERVRLKPNVPKRGKNTEVSNTMKEFMKNEN